MIRSFAAAYAFAVAMSAQAMSPAPLHQSDGMTLPSSADRVGHWLAVSACPESPNAKFAGVRCGVQGTLAVGGIESPPNQARADAFDTFHNATRVIRRSDTSALFSSNEKWD
jgi:hypothetical protein